MSVEEIKTRIEYVVGKYTDKLEYGNIRSSEGSIFKLPGEISEIIANLAFESGLGSTSCIYMVIDENTNQVLLPSLFGEEHNYDFKLDTFTKELELEINSIPYYRIIRGIENIRKIIENNIALTFDDVLDKVCKDIKLKDTDIYTEVELRVLRNYFNRKPNV